MPSTAEAIRLTDLIADFNYSVFEVWVCGRRLAHILIQKRCIPYFSQGMRKPQARGEAASAVDFNSRRICFTRNGHPFRAFSCFGCLHKTRNELRRTPHRLFRASLWVWACSNAALPGSTNEKNQPRCFISICMFPLPSRSSLFLSGFDVRYTEHDAAVLTCPYQAPVTQLHRSSFQEPQHGFQWWSIVTLVKEKHQEIMKMNLRKLEG